jgi:hypothetical protein
MCAHVRAPVGAARKTDRQPVRRRYRDSKLTRLLSSSLGGNACTAVMCAISPAEVYIPSSEQHWPCSTRGNVHGVISAAEWRERHAWVPCACEAVAVMEPASSEARRVRAPRVRRLRECHEGQLWA